MITRSVMSSGAAPAASSAALQRVPGALVAAAAAVHEDVAVQQVGVGVADVRIRHRQPQPPDAVGHRKRLRGGRVDLPGVRRRAYHESAKRSDRGGQQAPVLVLDADAEEGHGAALAVERRGGDDVALARAGQEVERDVGGGEPRSLRLDRLQLAGHRVVDQREHDRAEQHPVVVEQLGPDGQPHALLVVEAQAERLGEAVLEEHHPVGEESAPPSTTTRWPVTKAASSEHR